jgi:pimeloyl-ACP methyl ester carboxylesterase
MDDHYFDSNGVRIHYVDEGAGEPIVLVHGFAASLQGNWVAPGWFDTLRPLRRIIALDCRGHGMSDKPHDSSMYAMDEMADDVVRLMDHVGVDRADLFGYSMGGAISIRAMVRHPERFRTVTLGGVGNLAAGRRGRPGIAAALRATDRSAVTDAVGRGFRQFAERAGNNDLEALASMQSAERGTIDPAVLSNNTLPVLIVVGEDDAIVRDSDKLAAAINGARLVTIPGKDHLTVVADQRFKDAVVAFLQEPR